MTSLTELFQFLESPNPTARHLALTNLVGHTPKNAPQRSIFIPSALAGSSSLGGGLVPEKRKAGNDEDEIKIKAIKDLAMLCQDQAVGRTLMTENHADPAQMIAHDALSSLINLSDNLAVAKNLMDREFLVWLVSYTAVRPTRTGACVPADPRRTPPRRSPRSRPCCCPTSPLTLPSYPSLRL